MKGDNDLTKLARWLIPGWIAILAFGFFAFLHELFSPGHLHISNELKEALTSINPISGLLGGVLIAASGIPLGFSIYQIYFFLRWNSPFARDGLLPPFLPGRMEELKEVVGDLDISELTQEDKWREQYVSHPLFELEHGYRAWYQESYIFEAIQKIDSKFSGLSVYARYRYLHEIIHTLGASLVAIYLAFAAYLVYLVFNEGIQIIDYISLTVIGAGIYIFLQNYEYYERNKFKTNSTSHKNIGTFRKEFRGFEILFVSPAFLYIVFLTSVYFWANPYSNSINFKLLNIGLKFLLSVIFGVSWFLSKKQDRSAAVGDALVLSVSLILDFVHLGTLEM